MAKSGKKMGPVELTLAKACGIGRKPNEDDQAWRNRILGGLGKLSDDEWTKLGEAPNGEAAQAWQVAAAEANNDDRDLPPFDGGENASEQEEQSDAEIEQGAEEQEAEVELEEEGEASEYDDETEKSREESAVKKTKASGKTPPKPVKAGKATPPKKTAAAKPAPAKAAGKGKAAPPPARKTAAGKGNGAKAPNKARTVVSSKVVPGGISGVQRVREIYAHGLKNGKILSAEDIVGKMASMGYKDFSALTAATTRTDFRTGLRVLNKMGLLSKAIKPDLVG